MSIAFNNISTNKDYVLTNFGERFEFTVLEICPENEFLLKDLNTLESYKMSELLQSGKGRDFSIWEK